MDRPLHIRLKPSRIAALYCVALMFLSACVIAITALPLWLQSVLLASVVIAGMRALYQQYFLSITVVEFQKNQWFLKQAQQRIAVELCEDIFVGIGLIALSFAQQDSRKKQSLLLWSDSAAADDLRRLRLHLFSI